MEATFIVGGMPHGIEDRRCGECWAGYPKKCQCGGLIHAQFMKESWQGDINLSILCDYCGASYKYIERQKRTFKRNQRKK